MALNYTDNKTDFIFNKLTREIYNDLKAAGQIKDDELYFITDDPTITEVLSAYVTKTQLSGDLSALSSEIIRKIPVKVSELQNDANYLTAHQSLQNYYTKSQVSSASEVNQALSQKQPVGDYLTAHQSLSDYVTTAEVSAISADVKSLSNAISSKISVNGKDTDTLSVLDIDISAYAQLLKDGNVLSNALYMVHSDNLDAEGERILNVAEPVLSDDAATKGYVDNLSGIYQEKGNYLTAHQSLSAYQIAYTLETPTIIADSTTGKLSCEIKTFTVSTIKPASASTIQVHLPKNTGKIARDFMIRFDFTTYSPTIEFVPFGSENINYEYTDEEWSVFDVGVSIVAFTETYQDESGNYTFMVSKKTFE